MKTYIQAVILLFIAWILMSGNLPQYLALVDTTRWNTSFATLFNTGTSANAISGGVPVPGGGLLASAGSLLGGIRKMFGF